MRGLPSRRFTAWFVLSPGLLIDTSLQAGATRGGLEGFDGMCPGPLGAGSGLYTSLRAGAGLQGLDAVSSRRGAGSAAADRYVVHAPEPRAFAIGTQQFPGAANAVQNGGVHNPQCHGAAGSAYGGAYGGVQGGAAQRPRAGDVWAQASSGSGSGTNGSSTNGGNSGNSSATSPNGATRRRRREDSTWGNTRFSDRRSSRSLESRCQ